MKLKFLSISLLALISFNALAQKGTASYGTASEKFNFGIKLGLNVSNQNLEYDIPDFPFDIKTSSLTSFHVGVFGEFILSDKIELKPELLFSREGSKIDLDVLKFNQTLSYIKAPILVKIYPFNNDLSILAGPQFGFLVDDEIDLDVDDGELIDNSFKSFELSATLGLEYDIINNFVLGARYNLGLTDSSDDDIASLKNNNFQAYIGFRIL